jgi:polysaccharide export outer membrane protein
MEQTMKTMNKKFIYLLLFINIIFFYGCSSFGPGMDISKKQNIKVDGFKDDILVQTINMDLIKNLSDSSSNDSSKLKELLSDDNNYYIGKSDILSVAIWGVDEFSIPANSNNNPYIERQVRSDGTIFFPYIGEIKVEGLRVEEVRKIISEKLNNSVFIDSQVDVTISKYKSQKITLSGEFKNPQIIYLNSTPLSLFQAISIGGSSISSDLTSVKLIRKKKVYEFDFEKESNQSTILNEIYLKDKDIVQIPNNSESRIYVVGESKRPREIILKRKYMSLSQAIASSGGLNNSRANASKVFVLRGASSLNDEPEIFYINLKSGANLLLASEFKLKKQDIVFIGTSNISKWNSVIAQIFPFASLLNAVDSFGSNENTTN